MTERTIERIKKKLDGDLPGREAQEIMAPTLRFAGVEFPDPSLSRTSGVLLLLYPRRGELSTVFIERTEFGPHGGQISLPGGKMEEHDRDVKSTALREAMEEIGVEQEKIQVMGQLSTLFVPHSNFTINPVIGFHNEIPEFVKNKEEVKSIISISLKELFDQRNKGVKTFINGSKTIHAPYYDAFGHVIWGATAMIISEFEILIK